MFTKKSPKISVCIPVFGTEKFLASCLENIAKQNASGTQIIVVDDASSFASSAENCKIKLSAQKIVKDFKKSHKNQHLSIKFIQHEKNKGLVEARRSALYEADGEYILFVDSDDTLSENAIKTLLAAAEKSNADIVHGRANVCFEDFSDFENCESDKKFSEISAKNEKSSAEQKRFDDMNKKSNCVFLGELFEKQIFDGFLINANHCGFLWGKLFKKELLLEAFDKIPPTFCVFAEDFLTYFFISFFAKKYFGIEDKVYNYFVNTGISSNKKIDSLEEWQKVCSTASVFTILFSWIEENSLAAEDSRFTEKFSASSGGGVAEDARLTEDFSSSEKNLQLTQEEIFAVKNMCKYYAKNNLLQLEKCVVPSLQDEAKKMLCEFWGEKIINQLSKREILKSVENSL